MGGEKFFKTIIFGCSLGSPPRGRGKDPAHQRGRHRPGITPAWAGKRAILAGRKAQVEDHPRVGGEKIPVEQNEVGIGGSPPRGRGKAFLFGDFDIQRRITPAWAGKRAFFHDSGRMPRDHPRVGGEKLAARRCSASILGSPPRGRGKGGDV